MQTIGNTKSDRKISPKKEKSHKKYSNQKVELETTAKEVLKNEDHMCSPVRDLSKK